MNKQTPLSLSSSRRRVFAVQSALLTTGCLLSSSGWSQEKTPADKPFQDEPAAHALYTEMVKAMREATTLSWVSDYRWEARGQTLGHATYRIWLQKPNYARLEATRAVPMTYLIDREGKVVEAWYDYRQGQAEKALKKLGF